MAAWARKKARAAHGPRGRSSSSLLAGPCLIAGVRHGRVVGHLRVVREFRAVDVAVAVLVGGGDHDLRIAGGFGTGNALVTIGVERVEFRADGRAHGGRGLVLVAGEN